MDIHVLQVVLIHSRHVPEDIHCGVTSSAKTSRTRSPQSKPLRNVCVRALSSESNKVHVGAVVDVWKVIVTKRYHHHSSQSGGTLASNWTWLHSILFNPSVSSSGYVSTSGHPPHPAAVFSSVDPSKSPSRAGKLKISLDASSLFAFYFTCPRMNATRGKIKRH